MTPAYVRRLAWLHRALFVVFALLALRLVYLQAWRGQVLGEMAQDNVVRSLPLQAPRGNVYDCRGRVLVRNRAHLVFTIMAASLNDPAGTVRRLARLAELKPAQLHRLAQKVQAAPLEPVVVSDHLTQAQLARLAEAQALIPGSRLDVVPMRDYPLGGLACHVLGQVGEVDEETLGQSRQKYLPGDWVGKDGLESSWEDELRGRRGQRVVMVDVAGRPVKELEEHAPQPGHDLVLTLDAELQKVAEDSLQRALDELRWRNGERTGGVAIAMEVRTGKIRAMASLPGYDPSWFAGGISSRRFTRLLRDPAAPLLNRAVSGTYPPASTFKLVTSAAAFAEGLITPDSRFYCPGVMMIGDVPFNCFVRSGHGWLGFEDTLAHSCDVAFYGLGLKLTGAKIAHYAAQFGLGAPTGVDLPGEQPGNLPDAAWKQRVLKEKWYAGDDANMSIGQGFLTVTPLQMAVVTAAVASDGGVVRPYLVEQVKEGGQVIRAVAPQVVRYVNAPLVAWKRIRAGMRGAVQYGTSTRANVWELEIAGKTGTVENSSTSDNPQGRNHTWFVSFAPYQQPDLVVVVFLEKSGGYGGSVATPVALDIQLAWQRIRKRAPGTRVPEVKAPAPLPEPGPVVTRPRVPAPAPYRPTPARPAVPAPVAPSPTEPEPQPEPDTEPAAAEPVPEPVLEPTPVLETPAAEPPAEEPSEPPTPVAPQEIP